MASSSHCAVVGAGFIGLCTALELLERGCHVTLIDRGLPGQGASQGNAGFIATESVDPLGTMGTLLRAPRLLLDKHGALSVPAGYLHRSLPWMLRFGLASRPARVEPVRQALSALLTQAAPRWKDLLARQGLSGHLLDVHYLRVWEKSQGVAAAQAEAAFYRSWGLDAHFADHKTMAALEPALAETIHHAVVLPKAHRISDPLQLCQALFEAFLERGGRWIQQPVTALHPDEQGVGIHDQRYDRAVVCAGAHSAKLLAPMGLHLPLMAERGYHLHLGHVHGILNGPVCSAERNVFLNPLDAGLRVVGFSELGGTDLPAKPQRFDSLRHHLQALLPQLESRTTNTTQWMGMRPTLPDSLPVIDTHPHYPHLGFAFGHQHVGVTLAACTGQLMANKLLGHATAVDLAPYSVSRFPFTGALQ